jgi:predicted metal-dependent hydrolase
LTVSDGGLVVVVPKWFSVSRDLPPLLEEKKAWIAEAMERAAERARQKEITSALPDTVSLLAIGEEWRVTFAPLARERLAEEDGTLVLTRDFSESEAIAALRRWVHAKGCRHLPGLLEDEAMRTRFSYVSVTVKEQKSRWGSCSLKGNVNLNSRLLFLPPHLTRHVLLHELCHLKEMNHAKSFHDLLSTVDPQAKEHTAELKTAWRFVPGWAMP